MSSGLMETPLATAHLLVQSAVEVLKKNPETSQTALHSLDLALKVLQGLDPYLDECSTDGPEALKDLIHETEVHDYDTPHKNGKLTFPVSAKWSAGTYEGNFIAMVAKTANAKRVLEVGMFTGTTTLAIADALPSDGKVVTLELDAYLRDMALPYFTKGGVEHKIDVKIGKALDSIKEMVSQNIEPFDMIFIDADKDGYQGYYDAIMNGGLLRKGGLLLVDNTLYKGSTFTPDLEQASSEQLPTKIFFDSGRAVAAFNKHVRNDPRVNVTILPVRDGLSWIMYKE